jgi:hypothetical protein
VATDRNKTNPTWLAPLWNRRKAKTAARVAKAIKQLVRSGVAPSLRAISRKAEELDGLPLSPNTIYKNPDAYELYLQHARAHRTERRRCQSLKEVEHLLPPEQRKHLTTRIRYLRRMRKDDLIAQLLQQDVLLTTRDQEAVTLRDEVLRLQALIHVKERRAFEKKRGSKA